MSSRTTIAIAVLGCMVVAAWWWRGGAPGEDELAPVGARAGAGGGSREAPSLWRRPAADQPAAGSIAGVTADGLVDDVRRYANGGIMPQHKAWIWEAHLLVRDNPELARELAEPFLAGELNRDGRALVMDVLASAGSAAAQRTMLELLDSDQARHSMVERMLLVQRLTFVDQPLPETLAYLDGLVAEVEAGAHPNLEKAALLSMGAAVGHAERAGDHGLAARYEQRLRAIGEAREHPQRRAWVVAALGNTRLERHVPAIAEHAADPSWHLRRATASALASTDTELGNQTLVDLAGDRHKEVQRRVFRSLRGKSLDADQLAAIADALEAGRIANLALPALVRFLGEVPDRHSAGFRRIVTYLADRAPSADLRRQARRLGALAAR